jgi:hypothetical protein
MPVSQFSGRPVSILTFMPALPTIPNVLKVSLLWSISSDVDARTGLFFSYSGSAPNNAACSAFATAAFNAFGAFGEDWDSDTSLIGTEVIDLSSHSGGVGLHSGTVVGNLTHPISGASSVLVNYQIARRYRGGRPRSYLPWGDQTVIGNRQTWGGTFVAAVTTHVGDAFAGIIGQTSGGTTISQHVNVSYYEGFTVETNPGTGRARNVPNLRSSPLVDTIVGYSISTRIANQRRRG